MCLNARLVINVKKHELNIMVEGIYSHIVGTTELWANKDVADAALGLTGYVMVRRYRI